MKSQWTKRSNSSHSAFSSAYVSESSRISVPPELIPCLQRIHTQDYIDFLEDSPLRRLHCLFKLLNTPSFDYFMGTVIVLNLIVMIIETDRGAGEDDDDASKTHWTEIFGWVVLGIFVVELLLRLLVYHCEFWRDPWNVFDFFIVVVDMIFSLIGLIAGNSFPVSILRIFRLAKLARAFKVLRVFPELRLLLAGLISSISAIFWGTVLLIFFMLVWALVAVLFIHPLNKTIEYGDNCERCPRAYSSVMQATLTFWQQIVCGDSWGQATIPLIEHYPQTSFFFIFLYLSVGMAVTNLILGVVVNVAQQAQDALQEEDVAEKALFKLEKHTNLLKLCKEMDIDHDGLLSQNEVYHAFETPGEFQDSVLALDITKEEFDIVWKIIDVEQKGFVSYKELVSRLSTMKVSDTQFMLAYIKYYMTMLRNSIVKKMERQHKEAMRLEHKVEEEVIKMEHKVEEEYLMERMISPGSPKAEESNGDAQVEESNADAQETAVECDTKHSAPTAQMPAAAPGKAQNVHHGHTSSDTIHSVSSAIASDLSHNLLEKVRHDIATLQLELKSMLIDMNSKLCSQAQISIAPSSNGDMMISRLKTDLLVVPPTEASCRGIPVCCRSPAHPERHILEIPVQQSGPSDAVSASLCLPKTPAIVNNQSAVFAAV